MKKIQFWYLHFLTLASICLSSAYGADGVSQLKAFSKNVNSAQGEFYQQQIASQLGSDGKPKVLRQYSGQFIFVRPGKFVWTTIKPFEQKLLSDGKQLVMWDKDLNQVTYRPATKALASTPAAILFGGGNLEEYFDLVNTTEKNGLAWVELIPKSQKNKIDDLPFNKIGVGLKDNLPVAMELRDALDNIVLLTFSQILVNRTIGNQEFVFNPPPGAEIVRLK